MASTALLRSFSQRLSRALVNNGAVCSMHCRMFSQAAAQVSPESSRGGNSGEVSFSEQLVAACVLERLPVVIPELPEFEASYHELRWEKEQKLRRPYPPELINLASASDIKEDADSPMLFKPAPRETEADRTDNRRSLQRKLDRRLYLILKSQQGSWHFMEKDYENERNLAYTAYLAIKRDLVPDSLIHWVGNAPCGHLELPENKKKFFFRSQFLPSPFGLTEGAAADYAWVTKEEFPEYMEPLEVELMKKMLLD